jgi:hypothetical protein
MEVQEKSDLIMVATATKETVVNGKQRVLDTLKRGGRWPTPILATTAKLGDNTTIKWACALRKEGLPVFSAPIKDKSYYEWWYDENASIKKFVSEEERVYRECIKVLAGGYKDEKGAIVPDYPFDCVERVKVEEQMRQMELKFPYLKELCI